MAKTSTLFVYLNTRKVGALVQASTGAMSFQYAKEWLQDFPDYGISLNLPARESAYKGEEVFVFFDNLLPDNDQIRKKVAEKVKASSYRTFDLLAGVGSDCVGALRFLTEEVEIGELPNIKGKALNKKEIGNLLSHLSVYPLGMRSDNEFRLSIAGDQEKTALLKDKVKWKLPLGSTPTTHILKPPMGILHNGIDLSTSVENEYLCLKLVELFGLDVPEASIERFGELCCLVVERFDRVWMGKSKIARVAQEDFCQAMNYGPGQKYESDGGPGIVRIMEFLNASLEREKDRADFMKSQVLFWLLGATDGHAKNYSVFLRPEGFFMTPFYDIMSVYPAMKNRQIEQRQMKLAFKVGDSRHDSFKRIKLEHFYESAKKSGFSSKDMDQIVDQFKSISKADLESIEVPKDFPADIFEAIVGEFWKKLAKL